MEAAFNFKDENPQWYRRDCAFHESGHVVMAMAFGRIVECLTIIASSSSEGCVKCDRPVGIIGSIDAARKEMLVVPKPAGKPRRERHYKRAPANSSPAYHQP
jgi:hypothetical protein